MVHFSSAFKARKNVCIKAKNFVVFEQRLIINPTKILLDILGLIKNIADVIQRGGYKTGKWLFLIA